MTTDAMMSTFAWDGSRLTTSDEAKLTKIRRKNLSASASNSLRGCMARFAADSTLPRMDDPFSPAELGTGAHEVLENLYDLPGPQRTKENLERISLELADKMWDAEKLARHTISTNSVNGEVKKEWEARVREMALGDFVLEDPTQVDVFQPEWALKGIELAVPDGRLIPMIGFIDRTDFTPEGKLSIRDYKGLALDTPIPTTDGWKTVGTLEVGDFVYAPSGKPTKVTLKSEIHNRPCYEFTLSDGSKVISDHVHDWVVYTPKGELTIEAQHLYEWFRDLSAEGKTRAFSIGNSEPVEFPTGNLTIDPYILGAWLGDGTSKSGDLTAAFTDAEGMAAEIQRRWEGRVLIETGEKVATIKVLRPDASADLRGHTSDRREINGSCIECEQAGHGPRTNADLSWRLAEAGVKRNKHIPASYLTASVEQRTELVRGLMDTDGHWNKTRSRAVFVNTNARIIDGLFSLLTSLGVTVQRHTVPADRPEHKDAYYLEFTPARFNPFSLARKAQPVDEFRAVYKNTQNDGVPAKALRRTIVDIRQVESVPTQCIKVDAPEEMFLCGEAFIPTHNTGKYKAPNPRFADDYGDQLRIYTVTAKTVLRDPELRLEHFTEEQLARLEATGHYDVADARLLYTAAGKEREIIIEKNALDTTMAGFARSWDAMNNAADKGEFTTTPGPLCGWCPLANSCPSAKVTTDKARAAAAGQPSAVELGIPTVRPGANAPRPAGNVVESKGNETRDDAPHQAQREANMSTIVPNTANYAEDSAWKPEVNHPTGKQPNLNSYGFGGATGITSLAYEILAEKKAVSSQRIDALATTLSKLLWGVERRLTNGAFDWNHGLHTRLRGHLRTFIDNHPVPLNGSEDQWKAWLTKASEDITDMLIVSYKLIELDLSTDVQPYTHLAKDGVKKDGGALGRSFLPAGIVYSEAPVYEESVLYPDGARPNINCHGFAGVCGVVSAAYTRLHKDANATYTQTNLIALAATYGRVLWLAQTQLVGTFKWGHGLNGRLRGFLFDILDNSAPTVNQTVAEWEKWVAEKAVSQLTYLGSTSYNLYSTDFASVSAPFAALAKASE